MQEVDKNRIAQTRVLSVFLFLCICVGGFVAYAQDAAEEETSSGSLKETIDTLQRQQLEEEWQARITRSQEFLESLEDVQGASAAYRRAVSLYLDRRAEHRATCAEDLRNASKFTKFPTALRCYKADLNLDEEILRKEKPYLDQMVGVSEATRSLALTRTTLLIDSIGALLSGIESDVFETLEDLVETKQNLLQNYRIPQWTAVNTMKAEQLSTWIDSLVTRVAMVTEEGEATLDAATTTLLLDGITCLDQAQQVLALVTSTQDAEEVRENLVDAEEEIQACLPLFKALNVPEQEEEVAVQEQEPQMEISRKLRSRLNEHFRINK